MSASEHSAVLRAAVAGDDQALGVLVRTYHAQLLRFGRRVCRDEADADDAVQEAFIKLAHRPEVQRDAGVLAWLFTVIKHACLRFLRKAGLSRRVLGVQVEANDEPDGELSPEQRLERYRISELVRDAIAELEAPCREVIILRDIEGLSGPEVCESLALSEAAMKSRLHRARAALRDRLLPFVQAERKA